MWRLFVLSGSALFLRVNPLEPHAHSATRYRAFICVGLDLDQFCIVVGHLCVVFCFVSRSFPHVFSLVSCLVCRIVSRFVPSYLLSFASYSIVSRLVFVSRGFPCVLSCVCLLGFSSCLSCLSPCVASLVSCLVYRIVSRLVPSWALPYVSSCASPCVWSRASSRVSKLSFSCHARLK